MAKGEQKVYMPLMIGDWLKGTRGMKAEVRGVYINLLLYQWDNGFVPSDMDELCLIDPELPKVWVKLKDKFIEIAPGKLQNKKNEEVREFWKKNKKNGQKGGRPKSNNPKRIPNGNPEPNPKTNPNPNLHNDLDLDNDSGLENNNESFDFSKPDIDGDELVYPLDTPLVRELWSGWKRYRWKVHNARYGIMGEQADLKRLQGLSFERIESTILAAISGTWKNLYPEKNGKQHNPNGTNKKQQQSVDTADYLKDYYAQKTGTTPAN